MANHEYERPWQVMPAKIIKLALEHAEKNDDFDHQVAYLLLDIGVEAALKAYLANCGQNVEKMVFPDLLRKVKEELSKSNPELVHQLDDVAYFHGIRNKLYHQGDGVKPTEDNLKRYADLAKKIVEEILEVNLQTEERKHVITVLKSRYEFEQLVAYINNLFKYFQESCAIVVEKAFQKAGTREFAMKFSFILRSSPDREDDDPEVRVWNRSQRVEKFGELTGFKDQDHEFVDFMLKDINHFYVFVALLKISEDAGNRWDEYVDLVDQLSKLPRSWKDGIEFGRLTNEQVREEFEKILSWIDAQQKRLDEWIKTHMENIHREGPDDIELDLMLAMALDLKN